MVTGNGSGFTAAWLEPGLNRGVVVPAVVNAQGEPIAEGVITSDQSSLQSLAIAHSATETLLVWVTHNNVFAQRLSPAGLPLGTTMVSGPDLAGDVAVAWNGSRYFVVWTNGYQLSGTFVSPDGSATSPKSFFGKPVVVGQPAPDFELQPDVAWDGRNFLVVAGEAPNLPCVTLCPGPFPDHFRVMRVSSAGDAIDETPLVIAGQHIRAHVASSGLESLIALDDGGVISTIVAHDEGILTLDAERTLFRWYSNASSGVTWDGSNYTVGWRYSVPNGGSSWMGMARVSRAGLPFDYRVTTTEGPDSGALDGRDPSLGSNDAGMVAFAISEAATATSFLRARLYLASEFAPMALPPLPPRNVISYFGGNTTRIDWQSDPAVAFIVEWSWDFGAHWGYYLTVPGDQRTTNVRAYVGNQFRVRAVGPGGVSEGTITSIGSPQRRRTQRP